MKNQSKEGRNPSASPLEKYFQHYNEKNLLPLHMPGHQRKRDMGTALPYAYDYTEVEELDNLNAPEGILQEAMNRTAAYYGCSDCFYLVNGSSSGLQAGIFTLLEEGEIATALFFMPYLSERQRFIFCYRSFGRIFPASARFL